MLTRLRWRHGTCRAPPGPLVGSTSGAVAGRWRGGYHHTCLSESWLRRGSAARSVEVGNVSSTARWVICAVCAVLGVIALIYAVIYLAVPIHSLPGFVPGKKVGTTATTTSERCWWPSSASCCWPSPPSSGGRLGARTPPGGTDSRACRGPGAWARQGRRCGWSADGVGRPANGEGTRVSKRDPGASGSNWRRFHNELVAEHRRPHI